jgi:FtsH-binding integral membrane protein
MKKYLFALIPAVVGITMSIAFMLLTPTDYPDPTYPYRTKKALSFASSAWFIVGIGLSATAIVMIFLETMWDKAGKYMDRRSMEKHRYNRKSDKEA